MGSRVPEVFKPCMMHIVSTLQAISLLVRSVFFQIVTTLAELQVQCNDARYLPCTGLQTTIRFLGARPLESLESFICLCFFFESNADQNDKAFRVVSWIARLVFGSKLILLLHALYSGPNHLILDMSHAGDRRWGQNLVYIISQGIHIERRMSRPNGKDFEETLNWDSSVSSKEALWSAA